MLFVCFVFRVVLYCLFSSDKCYYPPFTHLLIYLQLLKVVNLSNLMKMQEFKSLLQKESLSKNTIQAYLCAVSQFLDFCSHHVSSKQVMAYKGMLINQYKPRTVNQRIQAVNKYLEYIGKPELKQKFVRLQQQNFLENVISDADYQFLKSKLFSDGDENLAMAVWYMGATGARISELLQIKAEHVQRGFIDLLTKGGKIRRLYIPEHLVAQSLSWLDRQHISSGFIFLNQNGKRISARGLSKKLKCCARKYQLDPKVMHPHSFRHRFAKNFLDKYQDLALLADLMGHESIETTRIYLRRTASEQQTLVNKIVDW